MIEVRLFGPGQVKNGNLNLAGFPKQQYFHVFCYLIISRKPHTREQLASTFWMDYTTNVSRKYLRDALWRLRHALRTIGVSLDKLLNVSETQVGYYQSDECVLDTQQFEAGIAGLKGAAPEMLDQQVIAEAEQAVNLYTGDVLDGQYEEWCLDERERLRLLYLGALSTLMAYHEAQGAYEKALSYGDQILTRDGTREAVHRQMMRLYCLMGNRDAAIRQYKTCVRILQDTLGMPPLYQTTQFYMNIAHNGLPEIHTMTQPGASDDQRSATNGVDMSFRRMKQRVRYLHKLLDESKAELVALEKEIDEKAAGVVSDQKLDILAK